MDNKEIKVTFETITPLYTSDAWQEIKEIRPSSLVGGLRFWFEVICYFGGICSEKDFDKEKGRFEKDIKNESIRKELLKQCTDFDGQISALKDLKIPIPAIIFGTTGWKSLIEINSIRYLGDYCFGNKLNLLSKFCISKNENKKVKENNECPRRSNNDWSVFYFKIPYFWGKFEVVFRVPKEIKETIFFPLLNFMDKYGYWGGGWNIGYGRLRVLSVNSQDNSWQKNEFDFSKFDKNKKIYIEGNDSEENKIVEPVKETNLLTNEDTKIKHWKHNGCNLSVKDMLRNLIIEKSKLRRDIRDNKKRHEIFGKTGNIQDEDLPQGSKIFPYINKLDNNSYECGLLSISGVLNLY